MLLKRQDVGAGASSPPLAHLQHGPSLHGEEERAKTEQVGLDSHKELSRKAHLAGDSSPVRLTRGGAQRRGPGTPSCQQNQGLFVRKASRGDGGQVGSSSAPGTELCTRSPSECPEDVSVGPLSHWVWRPAMHVLAFSRAPYTGITGPRFVRASQSPSRRHGSHHPGL